MRELLVDEGCQVTSIVENHVQRLAISKTSDSLFNAPIVLFLGLAFPGKDGDAGSSDSIIPVKFHIEVDLKE